MIRRQVGNEWWLISQDDHARLSGELGSHLGGAVQPLQPSVCRAIGLHDVGWTDHDAAPSLNAAGQPSDVFESVLPRSLPIWRESSKRAWAQAGDHAGLLVSIHSLTLSSHVATRALKPPAAGPPDFKLHFAVNKFQHAEIEQQEACRKSLGMRLDRPLTLGLAEDSIEPAEQQLIFDARWMEALDQLSLDLCCTTVMFPTLAHALTAPGGAEIPITVSRIDHNSACIRPWPFAAQRVVVSVPYRRLPVGHFTDVDAFHKVFRAAATEQLTIELFPPGPLAATA